MTRDPEAREAFARMDIAERPTPPAAASRSSRRGGGGIDYSKWDALDIGDED